MPLLCLDLGQPQRILLTTGRLRPLASACSSGGGGQLRPMSASPIARESQQRQGSLLMGRFPDKGPLVEQGGRVRGRMCEMRPAAAPQKPPDEEAGPLAPSWTCSGLCSRSSV